MEHWATARLKNEVSMTIASWLPAMLLAKLMSWGTIVTELGMSSHR